MTVKDNTGTLKTKTQVQALMTDVTPVENKVFRFDGTVEYFQHSTLPGHTTIDGDRQLAFEPQALYSQAEIDRLFPAAVISTITPSTGLAAAGGTTVTITGQNLTGVSSVTFGGTAGTSLTIISEKKLTVVTPAKTAGTYDLAVVDDSGTTTKTAAVTFV